MDVNIPGNPVGNVAASTVRVSSAATTTSSSASGIRVSDSTSTTNVSAPTLDQVKEAVESINSSLKENGFAQNVQFAVDPDSKRIVVQVIEPQTNKVIRQIPSEEIIQMSMIIGQKLGQVINQQA